MCATSWIHNASNCTQKLSNPCVWLAKIGFSARPLVLNQCQSHDFPINFSSVLAFYAKKQLTNNSTDSDLSETYRHPGAISVAFRCAPIVFSRTMFPCSLRRLCVVSLPLPCFLDRRSTLRHVRLHSRGEILSVCETEKGSDSDKKKQRRLFLFLKGERCHSCPRLHPHRDMLVLGGAQSVRIAILAFLEKTGSRL